MITNHGKAARRRNDRAFILKTRDSVSELVFSLQSKRRFGKESLEAAHWVMRTSF